MLVERTLTQKEISKSFGAVRLHFSVQSALLVARACVLGSTDNLDADVLSVMTSHITWNGDGFQRVKVFVDDSKKENIIICPGHTDQVIFFQEMLVIHGRWLSEGP